MRGFIYRVVVAVVLGALLGSCVTNPGGQDGVNVRDTSEGNTLNIVAGSEQKAVVERIVNPWANEQGYNIQVTYQGSVDQSRILREQGSNAEYDAFWFASTIFSTIGDQNGVLKHTEPMFVTPVVFAGWRSDMERLGFVGRKDVTIAEVLAAVEGDQVSTWMTNPTQSNSGSTMLMQYLSYFAGNSVGEPLTMAQLNSTEVERGIQRFVQAMKQTPPSTGTLVKECIRRQALCDTMFVYEALMMEENVELVREGREPFYVVYPSDGVAIADAPLGFVPRGVEQDSKEQIFLELQQFLLSDAAKQQLLDIGRRPVSVTGLAVPDADPAVFNPDWGVDANLRANTVTMPSAEVINEALIRYNTQYRKPVQAVYCLDSSGSMAGEPWEQLQLGAATVFDQDSAKRLLLEAHPKDETTVFAFSDDIYGGPWTANGNDASQYSTLVKEIGRHEAGGNTEMYWCVKNAIAHLDANTAPGSTKRRMIVVMTDGQSDSYARREVLDRLSSKDVPVIAIAFGAADLEQLQTLADVSGGTVVNRSNLVDALRRATGFK